MHRLILSALFFLFFVSFSTGSEFRAVGLATSGQETASSILARYPALEGAWVLEGKSWRQFPQDLEHLGAGMAAWVKKSQLTGEESSYIPAALQIQFPGYAFVVWPGKDDVKLDESGVEGMFEEISFELFEGDELKLGSRHLCVLSSQGNISCAGYSSRNRIGNQSAEFINTMTPIFSLDLAQ